MPIKYDIFTDFHFVWEWKFFRMGNEPKDSFNFCLRTKVESKYSVSTVMWNMETIILIDNFVCDLLKPCTSTDFNYSKIFKHGFEIKMCYHESRYVKSIIFNQ